MESAACEFSANSVSSRVEAFAAGPHGGGHQVDGVVLSAVVPNAKLLAGGGKSCTDCQLGDVGSHRRDSPAPVEIIKARTVNTLSYEPGRLAA